MVCRAYIFAVVMGSVSSLIMEGNQGKIQYQAVMVMIMHATLQATHAGGFQLIEIGHAAMSFN